MLNADPNINMWRENQHPPVSCQTFDPFLFNQGVFVLNALPNQLRKQFVTKSQRGSLLQSWSTTDMNITRRAGYPPPVQSVQQQPGAPVLPPPGPGADTRAAVSPRMMGKMNNIADYVLGSTSPKQPLSVTGIENSMGRMNIGQFVVQEDVNKNKADINTQAQYNETPAVSVPHGHISNLSFVCLKAEENGNMSPALNDNEVRASNGSRQESPSQDDKNGNLPEDNVPAAVSTGAADQGLVMIETPEQSLGHQPPMLNGQDPTQQQIPFPAQNLEALNFTNEVGLNYF